MKTQIKQYAGVLFTSAVVIGGIASAAITPIPTISNTFAVAGQVIKSADINKLAEALNILDARTNGTAPVDDKDLVNKQFLLGNTIVVGGNNAGASSGVSATSLGTITLPKGRYFIQANGSAFSIYGNGTVDLATTFSTSSGTANIWSIGSDISIDGLTGRHRNMTSTGTVDVTSNSAVISLDAYFATSGGSTGSFTSSLFSISATRIQ